MTLSNGNQVTTKEDQKHENSIHSRIISMFNPTTESWSCWFEHAPHKRFQGAFEPQAIEFLLMSRPEKGWKPEQLERDCDASGPYQHEYILKPEPELPDDIS
ncbi:MAG: hypothetical protein CMJ46_12780 [Planctomyces sp.]|nr:hypothetical protein [Planctomyces sp.]